MRTVLLLTVYTFEVKKKKFPNWYFLTFPLVWAELDIFDLPICHIM